jgi:RimJ/RimL family protein N-acetyltransferase
MPPQPRLRLIDATLTLLAAAVRDESELGASLGVSIADGWSGFPEALPVLRDAYQQHPPAHRWGALFFLEPDARALVGFGGFKGPPSQDSIVEIGYAIAPAFQGKGLATDAVAQMVQRAFDDRLVRAVDAHTLAEVNASTRVLEKSLFRRVADVVDPDDGAVWQWRRERRQD